MCLVKNIHPAVLVFNDMSLGHFHFNQGLLVAIHKLLVESLTTPLDRISAIQLNLMVFSHGIVSSALTTCSQWALSGFWEGHSKTLILTRFSHAISTFDVCLGSLSC